ncbi:MAG: c-type cytochrome domain-containing protein [Akkermansiaceae bacterium]
MLKPSLLILLLSAGLSGAADKVTFDDHIFPIFESKCLNCHNPDKKKGDLDLSTYTGTMTGSSGGKITLSGDGGSSKLYTVTVHTEEPVMPPEGDKIAKKDADLIRAWIDGGLLENKGSKAKKRQKPAFSLGAAPTGKRPEGPPPMPRDLLLEPVVTPTRATVVADMDASPWAPLLAVTGQKQILLYHSDTLELVGVLPFPKGNPETVSFHPSGKYLIAGGGIGGKSGMTVTWDITTGKEMMTMGKEFDSVLAADIRADLGGVALGGPSRLVKLWDTQEGEQIKSIKKHTDWVTALAYSPDGVLLATGGRGSGVQIWEALTGNEFHSLRGHQKAVVDVKWRADSNLVATASEDGTIRFWDMNQGKEVKKGTAAGGGILALDYARNGQLICSTRDRRVQLWKPDLGLDKQTQPFPEMITEVAFSHDAARYFTADWNGKIEVWNTADLKKIGELSATPPSIQERLVSITVEKKAFETTLISLREKILAAENAVKIAKTNLTKSESNIAALKNESAALQKAANELSTKWKQLDQQAKNKINDRDQIAQKAKEPSQKKIRMVEDRRKLAAEQQKLEQEHATANQALIATSRDSGKKREASNIDPQNPEKKNALIAAEKIEHQQRQIVQQLAGKIANHQKLLAAHEDSTRKLEAGLTKENARIKQLATEHQKLIKQRDQSTKDKTAKLAEMKAKQAKIPEIQKQLQPLRKVIQDKEKIVKTAKDEFAKVSAKGPQFTARLRKWNAAVINTDLIQARSELSELVILREEDPSVTPKIATQQTKCDELTVKYQAAKE